MKSETLQYAMFSRAEMDRRYSKARRLMGDQGLDALFISGEENFQYFAGTSASLALHHSLTRPSIFILPLNGEPIVVTQGIDNLSVSSYVTETRGYSEILSFPHQTVLEALNELGLNNGRVGVELGHEQRMGMPVGAYLALVEALPQTQFVDASDILIELRMVKSKEELGFIRRAADITGKARQRLFDLVRPDMTERDVVRLMRQLILEEGGDRTSFVILQLDLPGAKNQFSQDPPPPTWRCPRGRCRSLRRHVYSRLRQNGYTGRGDRPPKTGARRRARSQPEDGGVASAWSDLFRSAPHRRKGYE